MLAEHQIAPAFIDTRRSPSRASRAKRVRSEAVGVECWGVAEPVFKNDVLVIFGPMHYVKVAKHSPPEPRHVLTRQNFFLRLSSKDDLFP